MLFLLFLLFLYFLFNKEGFRNNKSLETCSKHPLTGYMRDGKCSLIKDDKGTHTVCAEVTDKFLEFTKDRGNDLISPSKSFPGLKDGDNWCLCANRWREALISAENNKDLKPEDVPKINVNATHEKTLDLVPELYDPYIRKKYI